MSATATSLDPSPLLPDPDTLRAAIGAADERARLLRRLLRAALKLQLHLTTGDRIPVPTNRASIGRERGAT